MSKSDSKRLCLLSAGLMLAAAPMLSAQAAYRCDVPRAGPEARACAMAAQGPEALRWFIERTRSVYGLYYYDYAKPENPRIAAAPAPAGRKLATR